MTSFSSAVLTISLLFLASLLAYTLWMMRSGRLSADVAVRWVLAEIVAIGALLLWSWLPLFPITAGLEDRELLVILAVLFFVLIAFLMLDSLARISTQTEQIKRLTQEIALLRETVKAHDHTVEPAPRCEILANGNTETSKRKPSSWTTVIAVVWIAGCVGFFVLEMQPALFPVLKAGLTAGYQE
jgi:hypothetical protein